MKALTKDDEAISKAIRRRDAKIDQALPIGTEVNVRVGKGTMHGSVVCEAFNGKVLVESYTQRRKRHWKHYTDVTAVD